MASQRWWLNFILDNQVFELFPWGWIGGWMRIWGVHSKYFHILQWLRRVHFEPRGVRYSPMPLNMIGLRSRRNQFWMIIFSTNFMCMIASLLSWNFSGPLTTISSSRCKIPIFLSILGLRRPHFDLKSNPYDRFPIHFLLSIRCKVTSSHSYLLIQTLHVSSSLPHCVRSWLLLTSWLGGQRRLVQLLMLLLLTCEVLLPISEISLGVRGSILATLLAFWSCWQKFTS